MKITSTLVFLIGFSLSATCQSWKIISAYSLGLPRGEMTDNIQPAHSLQAGVLYQLPGTLKHLSVGTELGIGVYASKRIDQTFQLNGNEPSVVPVNYNSNVFNVNLQARWDFMGKDSYVNPYLQAKGGMYNFFSNITVEDPDDPNGCHALQHQNIINDNTLYWSAGGGLQVNTGLFAKTKHMSGVMIDISVNTIRGGDISYINTKKLLDAQDASGPGGKPLNVEFINVSTQEIHEHTVAQLYTTPLRMMEFRAGVVVALGK